MIKLISGAFVLLGIVAVTPAAAQGVYIGPNGVGVDSGIHPRHRDNDRRYYRDRDEGRSVYREDRRYDRHRDFDDD